MSKKKEKAGFEIKKTFNIMRVLILLIFVTLFFILIMLITLLINGAKEKVLTCGDGTFYNNCSLRKPYFCSEGILINNASVCGCSEILEKKGDFCISKYQTNPKNVTLKYVLRGEEKKIDFVAYGGMIDYLLSLPKFIYRAKGEEISKRDFKMRSINEEEQRELLLPLLTDIQNIAQNKEDQVRIAISIIQNIPYGDIKEGISFGGQLVNSSQYPYEVLYYTGGVCNGRSELLAFLLRELGYGVVLFDYLLENHEVVGIKCPVKYSLNNSGYCFIETTGPSIITDNKEEYIGWGKLSSEPEIIFIFEGDSLVEDLYEYEDAENLIKINTLIEEKGKISLINHYKLKFLREKYGLNVLYNLAE